MELGCVSGLVPESSFFPGPSWKGVMYHGASLPLLCYLALASLSFSLCRKRHKILHLSLHREWHCCLQSQTRDNKGIPSHSHWTRNPAGISCQRLEIVVVILLQSMLLHWKCQQSGRGMPLPSPVIDYNRSRILHSAQSYVSALK